ncbi:hypothetical protein NPIL_113921 [Nephila pilipes]|uniref:Secreted protein n=1 Tax=Nephila pilipes TaxID=299642 RepID=A0A8X6QIL7_NEPPI|nr:hypothetical protein NPIL_113921 [Nephila pilipes]
MLPTPGNKNAVHCGITVCSLLVTLSTLQHSARNRARDQQVQIHQCHMVLLPLASYEQFLLQSLHICHL